MENWMLWVIYISLFVLFYFTIRYVMRSRRWQWSRFAMPIMLTILAVSGMVIYDKPFIGHPAILLSMALVVLVLGFWRKRLSD